MGTRALIKFKNVYIATHWDGFPSALGKELEGIKSIAKVKKIAKEHSIDGISLNPQKFSNWYFDYFYTYKEKGKWDVQKQAPSWFK